MPDKKKISELDSASVLNNGDLVVISQDNGDDSYSSKKAEMTMLGTKLLNGIDYTTLLDTTSKKPIGAINELRDLIIGQLPVVTESGSLVTFTTPLALPLVSLKANITATGGNGTPSSPVPISGFSSVTLTQKDSEDSTVDTFAIALGETIYGGVLDCKNGTATITHSAVDMGSLTYALSGGGLPYINKDTIQTVTGLNPKRTATATNICSVSALGQQTTNQIRFPEITDPVADIPTLYAGQTLVFELATPITLSGLTPDNFTTIQGENNIFADSGDVELSFKQGIQEYIDEQIATTQALIL